MSKAEIVTSIVGRLVTSADSKDHKCQWADAWTGFGSWPMGEQHLPTKADGETLLPAVIVAAWKADDHVRIAVEMLDEPLVPDGEPNRGGLVREFWLNCVRLVSDHSRSSRRGRPR